MTSVQFYASDEDHPFLLDLVLGGKHTFRVFEIQSAVNTELREFTCATDVLEYWSPPRRYRSVAPLADGAAPDPTLTRVNLRGNYPSGSVSYRCEGWGLIHLQMWGVHRGRLEPSRLAHNSENRAIGWADTIDRLPGPQTWDWAAVVRIRLAGPPDPQGRCRQGRRLAGSARRGHRHGGTGQRTCSRRRREKRRVAQSALSGVSYVRSSA